MVGLSAAIERDLRAAMVDGVDKAVFNSDAGANENSADIVGSANRRDNRSHPDSQAAKVKGPETLALYAAMIDGKYASMPSDLNLVSSVGTNVLYMTNAGQQHGQQRNAWRIPEAGWGNVGCAGRD